MLALSPSRWLRAKSPARATLTLMSLISCTEPSGPPLVTRTRCVSALPYWFSPSRMVIASRPSICGVAERAQEERHVQVLCGILEDEHDRHLGIEAACAHLHEVMSGVDRTPVAPCRQGPLRW